MKNIMAYLENLLKRFLYKKILLERDVQMAIKEDSIDRVIRIVPGHSKALFIKEIKNKKPTLIK